MKKIIIKKWIHLPVLSLLCMASAANAVSTPPLVLVSSETVQNMAPNSIQTVSFIVHSNVPTAPVLLNLSPNRTHVRPESSLITWQFTDNCQYRGMAHFVPPNGNCEVFLTIRTGNFSGAVQEQVVINYGPTFQSISPLPLLNFSVTANPGGLFFTSVATGQDMPTDSSQELFWTVSNTTTSAIPLNPAGIKFTVPSTLIRPPVFTNDCSNSVPANGTCNIQTTIHSLSTPGNVSQYLSVSYNAGSTLVVDRPTNFNIIASTANTRTINLVNKCPFPVWFGFSGGGQISGCVTDADCDAKPGVEPGTFSCNPTSGGTGQCFWKNPTPANGNYELAPKRGTNTVLITEHVYRPTPTQPFVWNGIIAGRTACTGAGCETADCGGGTGACLVGQGFNQPAMQFEPTLQTNVDSYDITSINGLNIPLSVEPVNVTRDAFNPYTCGSSGITTNQGSGDRTIGGCSWNFSPPALAYIWVADGGTACSSNTCGVGNACGLSRDSIVADLTTTTCGKFLGYWTAAQVCGINSSYASAPFSCTAVADGVTFTQMYGCSGAGYVNSCYTTGGQSQCCGCHNWQEPPTNLLIPSDPMIVAQCAASGNGSSNTTWVTNALPTLTWYKAACPPNYVYPYDDQSSSFTCSNSATQNDVHYRVTFCPDGRTGAPA